MKRIAIIHAWFGPFPNYFALWLNSCKKNHTIDFYILTDQDLEGEDNIIPLKMTLSNLKTLFEDYLGFPISLETPYKLCDYKIIFNVAIPNINQDYDFWGFCDCDLIFGDIRHFLTEDILENFPYIGVLGHFHLQKSNYPLFEKVLRHTKTLEGYSFQDVYTSPQIFIYDELPYGLPRQIIDQKPDDVYSLFLPDHRLLESPNDSIPGFIDSYNNADELGARYITSIFSRHSNDIACWKRISRNENKKWIYYKYNNGTLKCCYWENNKYKEREILYLHLFRRKMKVCISNISENYNIIPNKFVENKVTKADLRFAYTLDFFRCQKIYFKRRYYNFKVYIWNIIYK